jgi:hypothetical protein
MIDKENNNIPDRLIATASEADEAAGQRFDEARDNAASERDKTPKEAPQADQREVVRLFFSKLQENPIGSGLEKVELTSLQHLPKTGSAFVSVTDSELPRVNSIMTAASADDGYDVYIVTGGAGVPIPVIEGVKRLNAATLKEMFNQKPGEVGDPGEDVDDA